MIISEIGDIKKFSTPSKLVAFSILDPVIQKSGNFQSDSMKISKRGSTYLAMQSIELLILYKIMKLFTIIISQNLFKVKIIELH